MSRDLLNEESHFYLNKQILKILNQNEITKVVDFYRCENDKILRLLSGLLNLKQVYSIKRHFASILTPDLTSSLQLYLKEKNELLALKTGIIGFDQILHGGLLTGGIYEFYGNAGCGKTILIDTIVINIMSQQEDTDIEVLYLDTKGDFSAMRLYNIMHAKSLPDRTIEKILNNIRVIKVYEAEELLAEIIKVLDNIETLQSLRILVIDSLPAIFYQFLENHQKMAFYLNSMTSLLRELAFKNLLVFVTNIVSNYSELDPVESSTEARKSNEIKPAMGKYWRTAATHRILVSALNPNPFNNMDQEIGDLDRKLTLVKSSHLKSGPEVSCEVVICDQGVV